MSEDGKNKKSNGNDKGKVIIRRENFSTQIGESAKAQENLNKSFSTDSEPIKPPTTPKQKK